MLTQSEYEYDATGNLTSDGTLDERLYVAQDGNYNILDRSLPGSVWKLGPKN